MPHPSVSFPRVKNNRENYILLHVNGATCQTMVNTIQCRTILHDSPVAIPRRRPEQAPPSPWTGSKRKIVSYPSAQLRLIAHRACPGGHGHRGRRRAKSLEGWTGRRRGSGLVGESIDGGLMLHAVLTTGRFPSTGVSRRRREGYPRRRPRPQRRRVWPGGPALTLTPHRGRTCVVLYFPFCSRAAQIKSLQRKAVCSFHWELPVDDEGLATGRFYSRPLATYCPVFLRNLKGLILRYLFLFDIQELNITEKYLCTFLKRFQMKWHYVS